MDRATAIPLSENFIQNLADFIDENFLKKEKDISRMAFVFGGRRPALFLKKELSRRLKKSFFAPKFFSMDEFVEYTVFQNESFTKISDLEASFILYRLAKKETPEVLRGKETFAQFLPWAREILSFIEQLDLEDMDASGLLDIQLGASIGYDVPQSINQLLKQITFLRDAFHKVLFDEKRYVRGLIYRQAARFVSVTQFEGFDHILFCNLFYLHKTEEMLVKNLYTREKAFIFFQGDPLEWSVLEKVTKDLGVKVYPPEVQAKSVQLSIQSAFDLHSQVGLVREALKKIKNPQETVVVLPEPEHVIPLLSEISSLENDFNVSTGYPLKRNPLYSLFEAIFKAQETKKETTYYTLDYLGVLSHPLIKNLDFGYSAAATRILVHKIEEILCGMEKTSLGGSLFISLAEIEGLEDLYDLAVETIKRMDVRVSRSDLKATLRHLHELCFLWWQEISNFYSFAGRLEDLLDILVRKSLLTKYPLNLKAAEKLFKLQRELKSAPFNKERFSKGDIFKIFKNQLENEMISFSGSPLKGLQILGLFETRSLSFENVIVMDVNESLLPKLKIYEPLIPREVMVRLGLNRLEKEEEIQRYQFTRLISSAKNVFLIYQEGKDKEKSRFIEALVWERQKAVRMLDVLPTPKASFQVKVLPHEIVVPKKPAHSDFLKKFQFSASSLNAYLHCPLRFYYEFVLGLKEREDLLEEPEAADIGNFIHELLEETFSKFVGRKPRINKDFRNYFFETLERKFDEEFRKKMKSDAFLIKEVLTFRLYKFLDYEEKRDVRQIVCVEQVLQDKIPLTNELFSFKCKIDRIDQLQDGSFLVIDYKTGSGAILPASVERLENKGFSRVAMKATIRSFQLPLYLYFVQREKGLALTSLNAALYFLKNLEEGSAVKALFKEKEGQAQRQQAMEIFLKALKCLIFEILDPAVPFSADQEDVYYCQTCPFIYLCR